MEKISSNFLRALKCSQCLMHMWWRTEKFESLMRHGCY
uniref:Uncharacterized protein n=1 Tax=Lotus japonicus TaxID=34305 RepID=I3S4B8_LOTJA|nr:unknown [Lotus japonicus]